LDVASIADAASESEDGRSNDWDELDFLSPDEDGTLRARRSSEHGQDELDDEIIDVATVDIAACSRGGESSGSPCVESRSGTTLGGPSAPGVITPTFGSSAKSVAAPTRVQNLSPPDVAKTIDLTRLPVDASDVDFQTSGMVDSSGTGRGAVDAEADRLKQIVNGATFLSNFAYRYSDGKRYAFGHSQEMLTDYSNPIIWAGAYVSLYPFGVGAFEDTATQEYLVKFDEHVVALLDCADRSWAMHHSAMFSAFNVQQRRRASQSMRLSVKQGMGKVVRKLLSELSLDVLKEELSKLDPGNGNKRHTIDPRVRRLLDLVQGFGGNIKASDDVKKRYRNEIRSLIIEKGMPTFFVTVNPNDYRNRVVFKLTGHLKNLSDVSQISFFSP
jgi:hypothetical protein